mmetsp:Transcript_28864/g.78612  ORF Transcript_28864/g.78612 Transcript_28864/m.78612 type:complete len:362 (-) Transcript_28864:99-1184(-)
MSLADARQSNARTDERLNELQTAHDMLEDAHHKVLAEQNDSDARWQLVTLRAENTDLQQRIIKERDSLQAARDELQELNHKYGAVMLTQSEAENLSAELERARGHLFVQQRCRSEAEQQAIVLRNALDEQKSRAEIAATQAGQAKLQQAESDKIATELKQQLHGWEAELSERDERLAEQAAQIAQLQDLTQPRSTEGQSELHNFVPDLHSTFNTSLPSSAAELDTKQPVPLRHSAEALYPREGAGVPRNGSFDWLGEEGSLGCHYACGMHIGGSGSNPDKQNQDALFCVRCGKDAIVWGVLDGHGHDNGGLASQVGAREFEMYFEKNHEELTRDPQATMRTAFEHAHKEIRNVRASMSECR